MEAPHVLSGAGALVTGGGGFIGSHLVNGLLTRGARVRVLDNFSTGKRANLAQVANDVEIVEGDIRDLETCRAAMEGIDFVWHEAALGSVPRSMQDPATSISVNVAGTCNVFSAARDAAVQRVVYASSSSVYGDSERLPKREGEEGLPLSPYALSKWQDEELARLFERCFGLPIVGLRYFNVYGPRQDPGGPYAAVIPRFFAACARGEAPVIFGDGEQSRDFTYVGDVVEANLLAMTQPGCTGRAYNVGAGRRTTVRELGETICRITGFAGSPLLAPERAGDVKHSLADAEAAQKAFGFVARTALAEGLALTHRQLAGLELG